MKENNNLFTIIAIYAALLYCLLITLTFTHTSLSFSVTVALLLVAPVIFALFFGIGKIISLLESIDKNLRIEELSDLIDEKFEIEDEEIYEDVNQINIDKILEEKEEIQEDETENEPVVEEHSTPEIIDGKITCPHCGKVNKAKRKHCFLCGKELQNSIQE